MNYNNSIVKKDDFGNIQTVTSEDWDAVWGDKTEYLLNNLTAGVGFNLKMGASALKIDYAYMNKGLLSHTHRLGLTIVW